MDTGGVANRVFILKSLIASGSARNLALFRLTFEPPAIKIKQAQFKIDDLVAVAVRGKAIIQGQMAADVTYVDENGHTRVLSREKPVEAMVQLPGVTPESDIIPSGKVDESIVELVSPAEGMAKVVYNLLALATKDVIVGRDALCPRQVILLGHGFVSEEEEYITQDGFRPTLGRDVSAKSTFTYFVRNVGSTNSAEVQMEISPDALVWQPGGKIHNLPPLSNATLTPLVFLRYARLRFRSAEADKPTVIHIWFQAQG